MVRLGLVLLLLVVLGRAFWQLLDGIVEGATGRGALPRRAPHGASDGSVQMMRDPVCGMFVVPSHAVVITDGARRVYFCSTDCRDKYRARTA
jgi:YHS domain-containing protein